MQYLVVDKKIMYRVVSLWATGTILTPIISISTKDAACVSHVTLLLRFQSKFGCL